MDMFAVGQSLQAMVLGMCGIFIVMGAICLAISGLNSMFKNK